MKGLMAVLVAKNDLPGHFTKGKEYYATYEIEAEDRGWFTQDDSNARHWLSPWDGKDHQDIHQEVWIMNNFHIVSVK